MGISDFLYSERRFFCAKKRCNIKDGFILSLLYALLNLVKNGAVTKSILVHFDKTSGVLYKTVALIIIFFDLLFCKNSIMKESSAYSLASAFSLTDLRPNTFCTHWPIESKTGIPTTKNATDAMAM